MSERASIGLEEDDSNSDELSDLLEITQSEDEKISLDEDMISALAKAGEKLGFSSREQRRVVKKRSPYSIQSNIKMRPGMKEIFQEISVRVSSYDQETFEFAILALIEKEEFSDLLDEFYGLFEKDRR